MDENFLRLAIEFEERAKNIKHDSTRIGWFLNQARNYRRMAAGMPEPRVDSHHTPFWTEK